MSTVPSLKGVGGLSAILARVEGKELRLGEPVSLPENMKANLTQPSPPKVPPLVLPTKEGEPKDKGQTPSRPQSPKRPRSTSPERKGIRPKPGSQARTAASSSPRKKPMQESRQEFDDDSRRDSSSTQQTTGRETTSDGAARIDEIFHNLRRKNSSRYGVEASASQPSICDSIQGGADGRRAAARRVAARLKAKKIAGSSSGSTGSSTKMSMKAADFLKTHARRDNFPAHERVLPPRSGSASPLGAATYSPEQTPRGTPHGQQSPSEFSPGPISPRLEPSLSMVALRTSQAWKQQQDGLKPSPPASPCFPDDTRRTFPGGGPRSVSPIRSLSPSVCKDRVDKKGSPLHYYRSASATPVSRAGEAGSASKSSLARAVEQAVSQVGQMAGMAAASSSADLAESMKASLARAVEHAVTQMDQMAAASSSADAVTINTTSTVSVGTSPHPRDKTQDTTGSFRSSRASSAAHTPTPPPSEIGSARLETKDKAATQARSLSPASGSWRQKYVDSAQAVGANLMGIRMQPVHGGETQQPAYAWSGTGAESEPGGACFPNLASKRDKNRFHNLYQDAKERTIRREDKAFRAARDETAKLYEMQDAVRKQMLTQHIEQSFVERSNEHMRRREAFRLAAEEVQRIREEEELRECTFQPALSRRPYTARPALTSKDSERSLTPQNRKRDLTPRSAQKDMTAKDLERSPTPQGLHLGERLKKRIASTADMTSRLRVEHPPETVIKTSQDVKVALAADEDEKNRIAREAHERKRIAEEKKIAEEKHQKMVREAQERKRIAEEERNRMAREAHERKRIAEDEKNRLAKEAEEKNRMLLEFREAYTQAQQVEMKRVMEFLQDPEGFAYLRRRIESVVSSGTCSAANAQSHVVAELLDEARDLISQRVKGKLKGWNL